MVILTVNGYQMKFAFSQDEETPDFGGTKAPFNPLPEDERIPPPPPSNATQVNELPKNLFVEENDTDSEPLVLPIKPNSSKFYQPMLLTLLNSSTHRLRMVQDRAYCPQA